MNSLDTLNQQNHEILSIANVLQRLIEDRLVLDNQIVSELFFRYFDKVHKHLADEQPLYASLLVSNDQNVRNTTRQFVSGDGEIKRIMQNFRHRWIRHNALLINDHEKFTADARDIFKLIRQRTRHETERLYPLIRSLQNASLQENRMAG